MDYHEQFFEECRAVCGPLRGRHVLIVGCGRGYDCRAFAEAGASVTGLDIRHDVGAEFAHPRIQYVHGSIEASRLESNSYEIVYCVANMEHVGRIEAGFLEMVRLARPGGTIFSVAAPLWHSRRGHHIPCLDAWLWIHLLMNAGELAAFGEHHGLTHELPVSEFLRNDLWMDGEEDLTPNLFSQLKAKGFAREELLAAAHTLVCRK